MTAIVLIIFSAFVICIFLSLLLSAKKNKSASDRFLLAYLLFNAFIFFSCFIYFEYLIDGMQIIVIFAGTFQTPVLLFYSYSIMKQSPPKVLRYLAVLPSVYTAVVVSGLILLKTSSELYSIFNSTVFTAPGPLKISLIIEKVLPPAVYIYILKQQGRYSRRIKQVFSYTEGLTLSWLKLLIVMELMVWFVFSVNSIFPFYFFNELFDYALRMAFSAVLVIILSLFGIKQTTVFITLTEKSLISNVNNEKPDGQYSRSGLSGNRSAEIKRKIEQSILDNNLYLNPELSISVVAEATNEKPHHISEVFSKYFKMTFYDFINSLRVEEVKKKIEKGEALNKTLLALSYESGFNSKATFNRYFRKCTGLTPSEYQKLVSADSMSRH